MDEGIRAVCERGSGDGTSCASGGPEGEGVFLPGELLHRAVTTTPRIHDLLGVRRGVGGEARRTLNDHGISGQLAKNFQSVSTSE